MTEFHELAVHFDGDEKYEYHLDGKYIATTNHDEHGWAGMSAVDEALRAMAEALGVRVTEV